MIFTTHVQISGMNIDTVLLLIKGGQKSPNVPPILPHEPL